LLWVSRCGLIAYAPHRTRSAPPVPLLGLPMGAGDLCRGSARAHAEHLARAPRPQLDWPAVDSCRAPVLSLLAEAWSSLVQLLTRVLQRNDTLARRLPKQCNASLPSQPLR